VTPRLLLSPPRSALICGPADYRHQEDENIASRGSITMKTAVLKVVSGSNEQRFEVHHTPSRGHQTVQKWYLKADHPVEGTRWTTMIRKNIDWYKRKEQMDRAVRMSESSLRAPSMRSMGTTNTSSNTLSSRHTKGSTSKGKEPSGNLSDNGYGCPGSETSSITGVGGDSPAVPPPKIAAGIEQQEDREGSPDDSSVDDLTGSGRPPFEDTFKIQENYVQIQTKLISDYLHTLLRPGPSATDLAGTVGQLKDSVGNINSTMEEYLGMVQKREKWWAARLKVEQERQDVWEASLKNVVEEGEALEKELKNRGSKRRNRVFSSEHEEWRHSTLKAKTVSTSRMGTVSPPLLAARETFTLSPGPGPSIETTIKPKESITPADLTAEPINTVTTPDTSTFLTPLEISAINDPVSAVTTTPFNPSFPPSAAVRRFSLANSLRTPTLCRGSPEADAIDTDEEDEEIDVFFDAIDAGTLPMIVSPALQVHGEKFLELEKAQYSGYIEVRQKLDLSADNRPPTSLWSILKNSIGKGGLSALPLS
jgi:oxysterol-binding protein 1